MRRQPCSRPADLGAWTTPWMSDLSSSAWHMAERVPRADRHVRLRDRAQLGGFGGTHPGAGQAPGRRCGGAHGECSVPAKCAASVRLATPISCCRCTRMASTFGSASSELDSLRSFCWQSRSSVVAGVHPDVDKTLQAGLLRVIETHPETLFLVRPHPANDPQATVAQQERPFPRRDLLHRCRSAS